MTTPNTLFQPRRPWPFLIIAVIAGAVLIAGYFAHQPREIFFRAYLFAWLFFLGIALGSLCLLMLHNLTGGDWGIAPRPIAQAAAFTLPLLAILFLPILFGLPDLYPWARPEALTNETLQHRHPYLNLPFFYARSAFYFALWIFLAFKLNSLHRRWQSTAIPITHTRLRTLSSAGLILYLLTMSHAGIDWIMSRDTEFFSTAFGFILTVGQTLAALSFAIVIASLISPGRTQNPEFRTAQRGIFIDVGNILLTLVILWTYVSFMQFLVIWMGNSREDNTWYIQRGFGQNNPWRWIALAIITFHFFIPFFLLLFRAAKQSRRALPAIAWLLLISHIVEQYWLVAPTGREGPLFNPHWLDAAAFLAIAGVWLACFLWIFHRTAHFPALVPEPPPSPEGAPTHA